MTKKRLNNIGLLMVALVLGVFMSPLQAIAQQAEPVVAVADNYTISAASLLDVLSNDTGDYDEVSLEIVSSPSEGEVSITSGQILYTPGPSYEGEDTFVYGVSSELCVGSSCVPDAQAVVTIVVTPELIGNNLLPIEEVPVAESEGAVLGLTSEGAVLGATDVLADTGVQTALSVAVGLGLVVSIVVLRRFS